jgi:hypothetical protein
LLVQSGAKDFLSAQAISNIRLSEAKLETVQVFPKAWLQQNSIETSADLILNRIMVDGEARRSIKGRPIHEYLKSQEAPVQTKLVDVLESHLINAQTEYGLRSGDYDEFLQERLSLVLEAIEQVTGQTVVLDPDAGEPAAQREPR